MNRSSTRFADCRPHLERIDALIIARDVAAPTGDVSARLGDQINIARRHLSALIGDLPVHPGDLRV